MIVTIKPRPLKGCIKAIPSKSFAHRALISAAISGRPTRVFCPETSDDIDSTVNCLNALGARIRKTKDGFEVFHSDFTGIRDRTEEASKGRVTAHCGESGSTLRFLLPVACALGIPAEFRMEGRLPHRPMNELIDNLVRGGCRISKEENSIFCSGKLAGREFTLPGNVSSQYFSGLLFAVAASGDGGRIEILGDLESEGYIDMTRSVLNNFGVPAVKKENAYEVLPGSFAAARESKGSLQTEDFFDFQVEGDWSNAAFWLVAGAISGNDAGDGVACTGLNAESLQDDRSIVDILRRFGARVDISDEFKLCPDVKEESGKFGEFPPRYAYTISVSGGNLSGGEIDGKQNPDIIPVAAALACSAKGRSTIVNSARLRLKESDRLTATSRTLNALGASIEETKDGLVIEGTGTLKGGRVSSFGDHRIAMTAAIASCICEEEVIIEGAEAVAKSYPKFFEDFAKLGGEVYIEH
ncbi:MAG: 3-phosphoshikimate 1-carboxyvinyltransferase [Eubacteriales bacterium]|jgi:3-phosphoshikimate 1-carboxyvinyltransferase